MKRPYLLFDFDGTIANSIDILYNIMNQMAPTYGWEEISPDDFEVIRNMSAATIIRMAGLPFYKIPFLIRKVLNEYKKHLADLHPYPGIREMLMQLKDDGLNMALLSSNSRANVMNFLDRHELHYFDWVEGTSGVLQKHNRIKRQIRKHRLDQASVIYIGDESRDIVASKRCGIRVISVTWGFHTERILKRYQPDHIVASPAEIPELLKL